MYSVFKLCKDEFPITRMNQVGVKKRVLLDTLKGPPGDRLVGPVDLDDFLGGRIHHPNDFVNVVGHLPKPFLARTGRVLCLETFRDVAEDHHVACGKMVGRYCVSDGYSRPIWSKKLYLSSLTTQFLEVQPLARELSGIDVELLDGAAKEQLRETFREVQEPLDSRPHIHRDHRAVGFRRERADRQN